MALVVYPISIKDAIADLTSQITAIRRKTNTLIDYYIYPDGTPNEIAAYDPRLGVLSSRLSALSKLSYPDLAFIVDDSDALGASYLLQIIDQMLNAVHGIQVIFQNHYDRHLEERKPFETIYKVLEYREKQLKEVRRLQMTDPRKLLPEDLRANESGHFCRGAIQMMNNRDRGKIGFVEQRELLDEHRARLKSYGGAFLWWECHDCNFRLRYHVSSSINSNIHLTDEIREHSGVQAEYKSAFLVKCHVFHPRSSSNRSRSRRPSRTGSGSGKGGVKYGCPFCFATGKKLDKGVTAFTSGRELAVHMAEKHRKNLPPSPLLQKFNVAVKGKCMEAVRSWDINFL